MAKRRIDRLLVERGLAESREKGQALILAGQVFVNGQKVDKAGHAVPEDADVVVTAQLPYVGRGGLKLEKALDHFGVNATGKVCLDIGASTGGFTDCLLQRGAVRVHAVDTGAGQIAWKLRTNDRVTLHEKVNARHLCFEEIGELADLAVCDVSFISVTLILPALLSVLKENAEMVILVKPQFEVGRRQVGKGGIVRDPNAPLSGRESRGSGHSARLPVSVIESPILGAEGNREFLLHASR